MEPCDEDVNSFTDLEDIGNPVAMERVRLALSSINSSCYVCGKLASHLWMPQYDVDEAATENQPKNSCYFIPLIPTQWKGTESLCDEHIVEKLGEFIERRQFYFNNFEFPMQSQFGYYWF